MLTRGLFLLICCGAAALAACGGGAASPDGGASTPEGGLDAPSMPLDGHDVARDLPAGDASAPPPDLAPADVGASPDLAPPNDAVSDHPASRTIGDLYCPRASGAVPPSPLPATPQARLVPIAPPGGIMFLEGPVWLADRGVLLLSEWTSGHRILQLTPPQTIEVFLPATGSNGLALTPDGKSVLVISELPNKAVTRLDLADATKTPQPVVQTYDGQPFVQPNDLAVHADGTIYFTDYQAGRLYRRAPGADGALTLLTSATHANGVGLSPDEKTLYLNSDARVLKYALAADGTLGPPSDFATGIAGADGLAIDCAGNVYVAQNTGGALVVFSPASAKLGEIPNLPRAVTNAAFGGPDRRTLYITTSSGLYAIDLAIAGLPY